MKHTCSYFFKLPVFLLGILSLAGCLTVELPDVKILKDSADQESLTWPKAVHQALEHQPDLIQARAEVRSKARSRDSAAGNFLPSVEGSYERSRLRSTGTAATGDSMGFDIEASQPLFAGFGILADFLKAKRELEAEEYSYLETSAAVRYRLRSVYVELLRLEKLAEVNRRIAERRRQNAEMIALRYEAGREHLGSRLRAEAIAEQADFDVRQTRRQTKSQSLLLGRELGGDFREILRVSGDLEEMVPAVPDSQPAFPDLAEKTPEVRRLLKTAESFKAAVLSEQSVVWPEVNGTYHFGYAGEGASSLRDDAALGLKVSVPFFEGGKNIQGIRKANEDYQAAWHAAKSARDAKVASLAAAWVAYQDAIEQVAVRLKFTEAARRRAEIIRSQYSTGLVNFQDFDLAEQDLADSEKQYVQALAGVLTAEANWALTQGATLEEVLHEF